MTKKTMRVDSAIARKIVPKVIYSQGQVQLLAFLTMKMTHPLTPTKAKRAEAKVEAERVRRRAKVESQEAKSRLSKKRQKRRFSRR